MIQHPSSPYETFLCTGGPKNHFHHLQGKASFTQDKFSVQGLNCVEGGIDLKSSSKNSRSKRSQEGTFVKTLTGAGCNKGKVASGRSQTYIGSITVYFLSASFCASFPCFEKAS